MSPIHTKGCNAMLVPAKALAAQGGEDIPLHRRGDMATSYWEPTDEERRLLIAGGVVRLTVLGGTFHPAILMGVENR